MSFHGRLDIGSIGFAPGTFLDYNIPADYTALYNSLKSKKAANPFTLPVPRVELGKGAYGEVYALPDPSRCAKIVFKPSSFTEEEAGALAVAEAVKQHLLWTICPDCVPQVYDVNVFRTSTYYAVVIIMERVYGTSLYNHLVTKSGQLTDILIHLSRKLLQLQRAVDFVHYDLHCGNVFVSVVGGNIDVKIIDFGRAGASYAGLYALDYKGTLLQQNKRNRTVDLLTVCTSLFESFRPSGILNWHKIYLNFI